MCWGFQDEISSTLKEKTELRGRGNRVTMSKMDQRTWQLTPAKSSPFCIKLLHRQKRMLSFKIFKLSSTFGVTLITSKRWIMKWKWVNRSALTDMQMTQRKIWFCDFRKLQSLKMWVSLIFALFCYNKSCKDKLAFIWQAENYDFHRGQFYSRKEKAHFCGHDCFYFLCCVTAEAVQALHFISHRLSFIVICALLAGKFHLFPFKRIVEKSVKLSLNVASKI